MKRANLTCPECGSPMVLRRSRFGPFYGCSEYPTCQATHGAHPDGRPLGTPADAETKRARIAAHDAFDRLWSRGGGPLSRKVAYRLMRFLMGLSADEAHIGLFDKPACERLVARLAERAERMPLVCGAD